MKNGKREKSELDLMIEDEMKDPAFAKAWEETELEDQIMRVLIQLRNESGMTQKELAEKSGVRQSNISRIERGACVPTLTTLNAIAKGIGRRLQIEIV